jgi:serine/threonine protein phosphatase PrpC
LFAKPSPLFAALFDGLGGHAERGEAFRLDELAPVAPPSSYSRRRFISMISGKDRAGKRSSGSLPKYAAIFCSALRERHLSQSLH